MLIYDDGRRMLPVFYPLAIDDAAAKPDSAIGILVYLLVGIIALEIPVNIVGASQFFYAAIEAKFE